MIGIVIVAHGGLAAEFLAAVEHVVGKQPGMKAISIAADDIRSLKQEEICAAADSVDSGDGVVVATGHVRRLALEPVAAGLQPGGPQDRLWREPALVDQVGKKPTPGAWRGC